MVLTTTAAQAGIVATAEFPRLFGVVMDWPIGQVTATVVALVDGTASLYTTSTFGIIGGAGHDSVRSAAKRFVSAAEEHFTDATPTSSYPYPTSKQVRFYLLGYDGVRAIITEYEATYSDSGKYSPLFGAGQNVLTELRQATPAR